MKALHEFGIVSSFEDYLALPAPVLEDARLVISADAKRTRPTAPSPAPRGMRKRGRRG